MTPQFNSTNRRRHSLYDVGHSNYYNQHSCTEKIYNLLKLNVIFFSFNCDIFFVFFVYRTHGNCMKLSQFAMLYPQQFHEMLPATNRDNNLLKYL